MAWQRTRIAVNPRRQFTGVRGGTIASPLCQDLEHLHPPETDPGFWVWWQPELAMAWFRRASQLLSDHARVSDLNKGDLTGAQNALQLAYVNEILTAIANGFNALNIPWFLHQPSRTLWWKYFSGMPTNSTAVFSKSDNFNGYDVGWYVQRQDRPFLSAAHPAGIIPNMARKLFAKRDDRQTQFIQTCGIGVSLVGYNDLGQAARDLANADNGLGGWYYNPNITNKPFNIAHNTMAGMVPYPGWCMDNALSQPYKCDAGVPDDGFIVAGENSSLDHPIPYWRGAVVDDWRSFRGDFGIGVGTRMNVSMGQFHYLPWLNDWVKTLLGSNATEIVTSAREFAVYTNYYMLSGNGSLLTSFGDRVRERSTADSNLMIAASSAAAIGAALSGVTYGISAIIGAGVAAGLMIDANIPDPNRITAAKDDLGRFKPTLDHAWLSGNAATDSAENQPDQRIVIPDPPGAPVNLFLGNLFGVPLQITHTQTPDAGPGNDNGTTTSYAKPLAIGALALAAVALLLSKRK